VALGTLARMVKTMGLLLCAAIACTAGCSANRADSEQPSAASPSAAGSSTSDQCAALLPDEAFTALGWAKTALAAEAAGRCERRAEGSGAATVATRAVPDPGPEAARAALETQCEELRASGGYVDQPVAWLTPESDDSCFTSLAATRTGVAELYFVNSVDELVQVRIEALTPTEPELVQQAMSEIAEAASELAS
jgi:hypothetical protein